MDGVKLITQEYRLKLVARTDGKVYRKRARIVAVRMDEDFLVETEHGVMAGEAGDFLATNHPDDDPGSDVWPVSAARMAITYEVSA